LQPWAIENCAQ